ncbi:Alpha-SNAP protein [Dioscorea alata]|uniref:Alpha-SNAP protein n=1 Tax=Dioscorea alata TaxID=55571 RepID=A0ACB7W686_DIOAL|nr:Alpha-SNAP protein [Dioscorea alata]
MEMNEDGENLWLGFPFWRAVRRRFGLGDSFFASGNIERELLAKQVALDLTEDERYQIHQMEDACNNNVFCPIVGCGTKLKCLEDFEDHYHARHTASCSVCSRVYPTVRLLSIHISEAHDSFFQAKVARGFPMYECLVEGCGMKLKSYKSRQQHLVDKHKFPASFEFFKKAHPSKRHRLKHQHKQAGQRREEMKERDMDVEQQTLMQTHQDGEIKDTEMVDEEKMNDLVSAVSKLSTSDATPTSIRFGHRHSRGITFLPRSVQQNTNRPSQSTKKR